MLQLLVGGDPPWSQLLEHILEDVEWKACELHVD